MGGGGGLQKIFFRPFRASVCSKNKEGAPRASPLDPPLCPAYQEKRKNLFEYLNKEYRIAVNRMTADDVFLLLSVMILNYLDKKSMYIGLYMTPNKALSCLVSCLVLKCK